jgi:hypothetical protein
MAEPRGPGNRGSLAPSDVAPGGGWSLSRFARRGRRRARKSARGGVTAVPRPARTRCQEGESRGRPPPGPFVALGSSRSIGPRVGGSERGGPGLSGSRDRTTAGEQVEAEALAGSYRRGSLGDIVAGRETCKGARGFVTGKAAPAPTRIDIGCKGAMGIAGGCGAQRPASRPRFLSQSRPADGHSVRMSRSSWIR